MTGMNVLAKAVFDNFAESGDELEFHRGDVVTVIEQNTAGLEGWWLCSFHGKQGIAPGNRLRLLPGMFDNKQIEPDQDVYDVPPSHHWNSPQHQVENDEDEEYDIPRRQPRVTVDGYMPQSPTEIYDVPRASPFHQANDDGEIYDIPTSAFPAQARLAQPEDEQEVYNVPSNLMAMRRTPDPMEVYDVPPLVSRGPTQNDFTPEEVYDVPPRRPEVASADLIDVQHPEEVYDVPPSVARGGPKVNFAQPRNSPSRQESTDSDVVYDIPQSIKTPVRYVPSGLNSLRRMRREINALSTASASEAAPQRDPQPAQVDYIYDVPPQVSRDSNQQKTTDDEVVNGLLKRLSMNNDLDDRKSNRLSTISKDSYSSYIDDNPLQYSELRMDLNSALERLIELKKNLEDTVSKLLTMVKKNWRQRENLLGKVSDIQRNFVDVLVAVTHFIAFARGATANAFAAGEHGEEGGAPKNVKAGLRKLLVPVEEDAEMLKRALAELDEGGWDIEKLVLEDGMDDGVALDEVDSFVMSSRAVSDDAAQMAVFVHTHAHHIFKKSVEALEPATSVVNSPEKERPAHEIHALQARPLPSVPKTSVTTNSPAPTTVMPGEDAWLEDYDYVALEDKDESDKITGTPDSLSGLNKRRTQLLALDKELSPTIMKSETNKLSSKERSALNSLAIDVPDLIHSLSNSIEQFTNAVEKGNQPHTFVALSKQVILCAHKLVFVGDCVHQHVDIPSVKNAIQSHCSDMCNTLKHTVVSTKLAALQWPAVGAVQDMVDKMYDIAKCAHQIRLTLNNILY